MGYKSFYLKKNGYYYFFFLVTIMWLKSTVNISYNFSSFCWCYNYFLASRNCLLFFFLQVALISIFKRSQGGTCSPLLPPLLTMLVQFNLQEVHALSHLIHQNIVRLRGMVTAKKRKWFLIYNYMPTNVKKEISCMKLSIIQWLLLYKYINE